MSNIRHARVSALALPLLFLLSALAPTPGSAQSAGLIHVSSADTIPWAHPYLTLIDHPLLNANPDAHLFLGQRFDPSRGAASYNPHPVAVQYGFGILGDQWAILNRDFAPMPVGAGFNLLVAKPAALDGAIPVAYVHHATAANSGGPITYLNHVQLNGRPYDLPTVTPIGPSPHGEIGVFYDTNVNRWLIYNEDWGDLDLTESFFVCTSPGCGLRFPDTTATGYRLITCTASAISGAGCRTRLGSIAYGGPRQGACLVTTRVFVNSLSDNPLGLVWVDPDGSLGGNWWAFTEEGVPFPEGVQLSLTGSVGIFETSFETGWTEGWIVNQTPMARPAGPE